MVVMDVGLPKHSIAWEIHKGVGWICGEAPELQWEDLWRIVMNFCQCWTFTWVCVLGCFVSSLVCSRFFQKFEQNAKEIKICVFNGVVLPKGLGDPEWLQDVRRDVREVAKERGGPAPSSIKESDHQWQ